MVACICIFSRFIGPEIASHPPISLKQIPVRLSVHHSGMHLVMRHFRPFKIDLRTRHTTRVNLRRPLIHDHIRQFFCTDSARHSFIDFIFRYFPTISRVQKSRSKGRDKVPLTPQLHRHSFPLGNGIRPCFCKNSTVSAIVSSIGRG